MKDRTVKGRGWRGVGEANPAAKLTEKMVLEIREDVITKTDAAVARKYGVSRDAIAKIRKRCTWKEVVDHCHRITTETCQRSSTLHTEQASECQETSQEPMHG